MNHKAIVVSISLFIIAAVICIVLYLQLPKRLDEVGSFSHQAVATATSSLLAPSQEVYKKSPQIMAAFQLLAHRWNTSIDSLLVLVERRQEALTETGIVDISSLNSARLFITAPDFSNVDKLRSEAITYEGNIYLANEFKPKTAQQMNVARTFYVTPTPSIGASSDYAVIMSWDISPSGQGTIRALTTKGYLMVPVRYGVAEKKLGYYPN